MLLKYPKGTVIQVPQTATLPFMSDFLVRLHSPWSIMISSVGKEEQFILEFLSPNALGDMYSIREAHCYMTQQNYSSHEIWHQHFQNTFVVAYSIFSEKKLKLHRKWVFCAKQLYSWKPTFLFKKFQYLQSECVSFSFQSLNFIIPLWDKETSATRNLLSILVLLCPNQVTS